MPHPRSPKLPSHAYEKIEITKPDYSGFKTGKWIESLNNWIAYLKMDAEKGYFDKKLSTHEKQILAAESLGFLITQGDYQGIKHRAEEMLNKVETPSFVKKQILFPLGQQALGVIKQGGLEMKNLQETIAVQPVTFTDADFSDQGCTIL